MDLPRRVLVLGFRRTGQAVARVLAARGVAVRAADAGDAAALGLALPSRPGLELRLGVETPALLDGVDLVVPSPGVPRGAPLLREAVRRGIPVWAEVELAFRLLACPLVAITGTNGKSTTTTLVGHALARGGRRTFTGGNLGTPLIVALEDGLDGGAPPEIAVTEVSSFQLEWVERFRPRVGCLLNVTADHLDRHADFAEYRDAKARLFAAQQPEDWAVLNRDDPECRRLAERCAARVLTFGVGPAQTGAVLQGGAAVVRLPGAAEERYGLARTRLAGRHNLENILAAALVARLAGAPAGAVQEAIDAVEPLPHRLALVTERCGVRWYDDSKATNVGATVRSLESFAAPVVLLAGGVDKGGDYAPLAAAARGRVRCALLFGAARDRIGAALEGVQVAVERVADLPAAVGAAAAMARPGDVVLLAPACSSFDMFTDYAARGRAFRAAVEGLP
jgi:UDP-N-acetylmuramoylalanine--D-glutamate ligase